MAALTRASLLRPGHLATVQLLLKRKANAAAKDKKGSTALDLATDPGVRAALEAALSAAAQPQVRFAETLASALRGRHLCNAEATLDTSQSTAWHRHFPVLWQAHSQPPCLLLAWQCCICACGLQGLTRAKC